VNTKRLLTLLLLVPAIALIGCEGDEGPAGPAGPEGPAGPQGPAGDITNCTSCHAADAFDAILAEYSYSGHAGGASVDYAGGRSYCGPCHSHEQFVQYVDLGGTDATINNPSAIGCTTCHEVHESFVPEQDYALRADDPIMMIWDETVELDIGDSSNLCSNCHQSRRAEPNVSDPGDTFEITSVHYGPHHGPQANVWGGVGFAEIAGDAAYDSGTGAHSCTVCHMSEYDGGEGGHTWHIDMDFCLGCHDQQFVDDITGPVETKLNTLRDRLLALGVIEEDAEEPGVYHPVLGTYPMAQAQAFFNWIGLAEDRSLGLHNPGYVEALLDNSIAAIE
jgi:hypothetical protein